jgi:hypothetical protein
MRSAWSSDALLDDRSKAFLGERRKTLRSETSQAEQWALLLDGTGQSRSLDGTGQSRSLGVLAVLQPVT